MFLDKYVMKDHAGDAVENVINITLPLPAIFAAHVQAQLMGATQQPEADGDIPAEQKTEIEAYLNHYFRE